MSTGPHDDPFLQAAAEEWLERETRLPPAKRAALARLVPVLLGRLGANSPVGIAGPPGSGKSTLARLLAHVSTASGTPACVLSLDDYYLGRAEREQGGDHCGAQVHPLFRRRGVPGTHDLPRLLGDLDRLQRGDISGLKLSVFDKSADDRAPEAQWRLVQEAPRVVLLEGWCLGAPPQAASELQSPINDTERLLDPDASWRRAVNDQLARYQRAFDQRLAQLWYVRVPGWSSVIEWRWQQEQELPAPRLQSRGQVEAFLGTFERLVLHMQASAATWADLLLKAQPDHEIVIDE